MVSGDDVQRVTSADDGDRQPRGYQKGETGFNQSLPSGVIARGVLDRRGRPSVPGATAAEHSPERDSRFRPTDGIRPQRAGYAGLQERRTWPGKLPGLAPVGTCAAESGSTPDPVVESRREVRRERCSPCKGLESLAPRERNQDVRNLAVCCRTAWNVAFVGWNPHSGLARQAHAPHSAANPICLQWVPSGVDVPPFFRAVPEIDPGRGGS